MGLILLVRMSALSGLLAIGLLVERHNNDYFQRLMMDLVCSWRGKLRRQSRRTD